MPSLIRDLRYALRMVIKHPIQSGAAVIRVALASSMGAAAFVLLVICANVANLALGLVLAWPLTRVLSSMLYGVRADDPWVLGGVAALLAAVTLAASLLPARQAARVDPIEVLRCE